MKFQKGDRLMDKWGRKGECRGSFMNHSVPIVILQYDQTGNRLYLKESEVRRVENGR